MVKLKGPMMSMDASGSIGNVLVFSKWKGRNYARRHVIPANPQSGLQVGMRAMLSWMTKRYGSIAAATKLDWAAFYSAESISGINGYLKFNQPRVRRGLGIFEDKDNTPAAAIAAPTAVVATAAVKSVNLTWVASIGANPSGTIIYMSKTTGFTPGPDTIVQAENQAILAKTIIGLTTGTPYYFRLGGFANEGTLGLLAAQVTATPT
jgi:hypothetical protein